MTGIALRSGARERQLDGATERRGALFGARRPTVVARAVRLSAGCKLFMVDATTTPNDANSGARWVSERKEVSDRSIGVAGSTRRFWADGRQTTELE